MNDATLLNLLRHLEPNPPIVAVTHDEVAVLRNLGYVHPSSLSLTPRGNLKTEAGRAVSAVDNCQFGTTKPLGALSQSARHRKGGVRSATRYARCKNRATETIKVGVPGCEREVRCCKLHKRLHDEQGWLP